jgi:hypothetical protein
MPGHMRHMQEETKERQARKANGLEAAVGVGGTVEGDNSSGVGRG